LQALSWPATARRRRQRWTRAGRHRLRTCSGCARARCQVETGEGAPAVGALDSSAIQGRRRSINCTLQRQCRAEARKDVGPVRHEEVAVASVQHARAGRKGAAAQLAVVPEPGR
jgi:hypothetical protein